MAAIGKPVSHFNSGVGSWNAIQNFFGISLIQKPDLHPSGGHPGGYVSISDTDSGAGEALAAFTNFESFHGNFRSRYGANISFDLRAHGADISRRTRVMIGRVRNGHTTTLESKLAKPTPSWKHYKVSLVPSSWTVIGPGDTKTAPSQRSVSKAKLKGVLRHLAGAGIIADYTTADGERVDLDNPKIGRAPHH